MKNKSLGIMVLVFGVIGFLDAVYLTAKDFMHSQVSCSILSGCNEVLGSKYAHIGPIPLAMIGAGYYAVLIVLAGWFVQTSNPNPARYLFAIAGLGLLISVGLIYLQVFIIHSVCMYCLGSAVITLLLFIFAYSIIKSYKKLGNETK